MTDGLQIRGRGDREVEIVRTFDSPRELVFRALVEPPLIQRWLGIQNGWTLPVCEVDLRVGGQYRYVWRRSGGAEMTATGEFVEIDAPGRLVATEQFEEAWYPGQAVNTTALEERDGRTVYTLTCRYESVEARNLVLASPMEEGMEAGFDRLDGLLTALG